MHEISTYFTPIQPVLLLGKDKVFYKEVFPTPELADYIYCYWELKSQERLKDSFPYRVVADGCMDILWEVSSPHIPYVVGYADSFTEFPLGTTFHYRGIRFLPSAFPLGFQVNAQELRNHFESLDSVLPRLAIQLTQVLEQAKEWEELKEKLDHFFQYQLLKEPQKLDPRLAHAIEYILRQHGSLSTTRDLDVGLSPRQLRRVFQFYIGDSPKSFCKVVRFQSLLRAKPSRESLRKNKLFFDLGYYDQAHFIKEFKRMYGESPTVAFS